MFPIEMLATFRCEKGAWGGVNLHQMLVLQKQIRDQKWPDCPWVFFRQGKRIKDFRGAWEEAGTRAGLWNDEAGKPKHIFHDLRRTGARNLVRAGVPERVVPAIG